MNGRILSMGPRRGSGSWVGFRPVTALLLLLLAPLAGLTAQDISEIDEDALFGGSSSTGTEGEASGLEDDLFGGGLFEGDDMIEDLPEPGTEESDGSEAYLEFLSSDEVQIIGSLNSSLSAYWSWSEYPEGGTEFTDNAEDLLGISLSGSLAVNARPSSDLRIFMKARTSYPFTSRSDVLTSAEYVTSPAAGITTESTSISSLNVSIFEFYSDVNWDQRLFFRFGKQTVNWGVGYFYSPADFISLVPIDPDDPEAEREGPVAIKVSYPFGLSMIDAYLIGDESVRKLEDLGYALRSSIFIAPGELQLGLGYQKDRPLRIMSSYRLPLRNWNLFAEGRLSFGRQGNILSEPGDFEAFPPVLPVYEEDDSLYFSGTAGFLYTKSDIFESGPDLSLIGQYYYQGEGYDDPDLYSWVQAGVFSGDLDPSALDYLGQHYSSLSLSLGQLFVDDLSLSSFWQANWTDLSGLVNTSLSYRFFSGLSLSLGVLTSYGDDPGEYAAIGGFATAKNPFGDLALSVGVNLGGGRF